MNSFNPYRNEELVDFSSYPVQDDDFSIEEEDEDEVDAEEQILEQIQGLHRQLAQVRRDNQSESDKTRLYEQRNKLIICSLHFPVKIVKSKTGDAWEYRKSSSGFNAAIESLRKSHAVEWISWPGTYIDKRSQDGVRAKLESDYQTHPVFFTRELEEMYHRTCCLKVLWPLFHNISSNSLDGLIDNFGPQFEAYTHANHLFLDAISQVYEEGDLVMVWDYQLMLLPALLRRRLPEATCGFFLGTPFPSTEFFRMLPVRQVLMQGVLGADLVTFSHFDHVRHFLNAATRILGAECFPSRIEYGGRLISVSINPMGIDPDSFAFTPAIQDKIAALQRRFRGKRVIVSLDRLDVIKGIPLKLLVLEALLARHPKLRGKVVFVLVADDKGLNVDKSLRTAVDRLVGRVNGLYGKSDYVPVQYLKKCIPFEDVVALNAVADVGLVTSLRESVNMNALEFVACQQEASPPACWLFVACQQEARSAGVLVYSEFAAAASALKAGALIVNPYDVDKTADAVKLGLSLGANNRKVRQTQLFKYVNKCTAQQWGFNMVQSLVESSNKAREHNSMERLDVPYLASFYGRSRRRLLALDYDGTLVPHAPIPEFADPSSALINALEALTEDPLNAVYIISGRKRCDLEEYFGEIPNLGLVAEGGLWVKKANRAQKSSGAPVEVQQLQLHTAEPVGGRRRREQHPGGAGGGAGAGGGEEEGLDRLNYSIVGVEFDIDDQPGALGGGGPLPSPGTGGGGGGGTGTATPGGQPEEDRLGWRHHIQGLDLQWKSEVLGVIQAFTERTPGAYMENKECSIYWHFQDADPDYGLNQAKQMQLHFEQMLHNRDVRILMCPAQKYVVVQPKRVNKGRTLSRLLMDESPATFDFIFAVGDERTDEDMYDVLMDDKWKSSSFTCTVGRKVSHAAYFLDAPDEVLKLLQSFTMMSHSTTASAVSSQFGSEAFLTATDKQSSEHALSMKETEKNYGA
eukprot:CAMPEP_0194588248 /NCGR_PEP_ID=MMETSP0292-20121207/19648_1 /TAXON_ID=39354 /ORGANISM="Heterosigma akashiwo, Strain CCMP2393" /LENGTH=971 /DNA_ID=CAMNT_0039444677 /DNA_START=88 /DNA_END=3003 /DNA_ORIENTATION=-